MSQGNSKAMEQGIKRSTNFECGGDIKMGRLSRSAEAGFERPKLNVALAVKRSGLYN